MNALVWRIHVGATFFMTGLIWLIQCVHYPTFAWVDVERFQDFEAMHQSSISWIVGPVMLAELVTGCLLLRPRGNAPVPRFALGCGLILLIILWGATALIQVPLHTRLLEEGSNPDLVHSLVLGNWIRTIAWSLRSLLWLVLPWH